MREGRNQTVEEKRAEVANDMGLTARVVLEDTFIDVVPYFRHVVTEDGTLMVFTTHKYDEGWGEIPTLSAAAHEWRYVHVSKDVNDAKTGRTK